MSKTVNSRAKGAAYEREVAALLRAHGYPDARRGQQYSGANGDPDVIGGPDGVWIECKRCEAARWESWIAQAADNAAVTGKIPVVVWRRSHMDSMATLRLVDLLQLLQQSDREEGA